MTFFFDNTMSPRIVTGLRAFGEGVLHLTEKFPAATPDEEWLPYVGKKGMILITHDDRIRRRPAELRAFQRHKVGAFILVGKNLRQWQIIVQVIRNWEKIKELAEKTPKPFAFRVRSTGTDIKRIM